MWRAEARLGAAWKGWTCRSWERQDGMAGTRQKFRESGEQQQDGQQTSDSSRENRRRKGF
ncbi:MFS general substrate transporter [Sesbania bispinosa]|nr:MFS general substrate transporter [Sesbania bispinosa]